MLNWQKITYSSVKFSHKHCLQKSQVVEQHYYLKLNFKKKMYNKKKNNSLHETDYQNVFFKSRTLYNNNNLVKSKCKMSGKFRNSKWKWTTYIAETL